MKKYEIAAIAAVDRNLAIGKNGKLLCHIPGDLKHFKRETAGGILIMGRKTLESLPGGMPLSGRTTIVLSSRIPQGEFLSQEDTKAFAVKSKEEAFLLLEELEKETGRLKKTFAVPHGGFSEQKEGFANSEEYSVKKVFIAGGEKIYKLFLEDCTYLILTIIDAEFEGADAFFPEFEEDDKFELESEGETFEENGYRYAIYRYVRRGR